MLNGMRAPHGLYTLELQSRDLGVSGGYTAFLSLSSTFRQVLALSLFCWQRPVYLFESRPIPLDWSQQHCCCLFFRPFLLKDRVWLCVSKMCSNPLPYLGALTLWELPGLSPQEESVSLPCANSAVPVVHACVKPVSQPVYYISFFKIRYWKFYRNFFPDMKIKIVQGWDKSLR